MKKICAYFAALLVLAVFGMTVFAHAGDLPAVPLTHSENDGLSEVSTEYEVPVSISTGEALRLSKTQMQLIYRQQEILTANDTVTWQSSNAAVAKVDAASGKVTAVGAGTATVTAVTDDGRTESCTVTVRYTWWQQFIRLFLFGWIWY